MKTTELEYLLDTCECLLADGLEDALIGVSYNNCNCRICKVAVYDTDKVIDILMKRDKMSYEEAIEFFDFNIVGSYVGEKTPLFVKLLKTEK